MPYNTDNELGSSDLRDVWDNAANADRAVNSQESEWEDRLGRTRKTWAGIESDSAEKLALIDAVVSSLDSAGVITVPDVASGLAATSNGQYFRVIIGGGNSKSFTYYRNINGAAIEITSLASDAFSAQLNSLAETTQFYSASPGGEYELPEGLGPVRIDGNKEIIDYILNGILHSMVPGAFPKLTTGEITVGGKSIDPDGVLKKEAGENLTRLSNSSRFFGGEDDEIELGDNPFIRTDSEGNIVFDNLEYLNKKKNWDEAYEKSKNVEPQKINPLIPFTQTDAAGKSQVRVFNTEINREYAVTTGHSNETDVRPEGLDRIVWKSDRVDTAPGGLFYAALPDLKEHSYIARPAIAGWGHSFMDNPAFLNRLAALTGLPTYNFGKSSARSTGIAARQGGSPAFYMPEGGVIPAAGSVNLLPNVAGPAGNYSNGALSVPPSVLAGVPGVFTWDGTQAVFTRSTPGIAVSVPEPVPLYVRPFTTRAVANSSAGDIEIPLHDEFINIFWLGRNNISQTDTIIKNAVEMVNYLKTLGKRVLILPDFNAGDEPRGSAGYVQMTILNAALKNAFPEYYCEIDGVDLRANFIAHGNPAYSVDAEFMAQDMPPRSLRYDYLHPAQSLVAGASGVSLAPEYALGVGAEINAQFVYDKFKLLGWVN